MELLINYLYSSKIPSHHTETHLHHLYELYFLADRIKMIEVMDKTMDAIQATAVKYNLMDELIDPNLVQQAIQIPQKNKGLRLFCIDMMIYAFLKRWIEHPEDSDTSSNDSESGDQENEIVDTRVYIEAKDLKWVLKLSQNDFAFFNTFTFRLCQQVQRFAARPDILETQRLADPRRCHPNELCYYHCHRKSHNCAASTEGEVEVQNSFVRLEKGGSS